MNQIKIIEVLPEWDWTEHCGKEIQLNGVDLIRSTDYIYQIGNCAVVGFNYYSFASPPWMWFVLSKGVTVGDLLDFRRINQLIPRGTLTGIAEDFSLGVRFAELFGFEATGENGSYAGVGYKIFRRK